MAYQGFKIKIIFKPLSLSQLELKFLMSSDYAMAIVDIDLKNKHTLLYLEPIHLESKMDELQNQLIDNDKSIKRLSFYFPRVAQAKKIKNFILKFFVTIGAFFIDLIILPFCYQSYKNKLKEHVPIYKYLKEKKLPEKYLKTDALIISFFKVQKKGGIRPDTMQDTASLIDVNKGIVVDKDIRDNVKYNSKVFSNTFIKT